MTNRVLRRYGMFTPPVHRIAPLACETAPPWWPVAGKIDVGSFFKDQQTKFETLAKKEDQVVASLNVYRRNSALLDLIHPNPSMDDPRAPHLTMN
jgi:hypothetical protein